jgi:hypothetical protein
MLICLLTLFNQLVLRILSIINIRRTNRIPRFHRRQRSRESGTGEGSNSPAPERLKHRLAPRTVVNTAGYPASRDACPKYTTVGSLVLRVAKECECPKCHQGVLEEIGSWI